MNDLAHADPAAANGAPQASGEPVIDAVDLGKVYHIYDRPRDRLLQALFRWKRRFYREFWALRHVSLRVPRGQTLGIIGRNGSGKSTLLQLIAGTLTPSEGSVAVRGRVAALLELGSGFNPEFTGRENVFLNGAILGMPRREMERRFDAIAAFAEIGEFLDQPVKTYSSGMVVRLAFAVQVQIDPEVLIVDEALAVGDLLFQKRCFQRLRELKERGTTILFVSHDLESVRTLSDRAIFFDRGQICADGPPGEVVLSYRRFLHEEEARASALATQRVNPVEPAPAAKPAPTGEPRVSFGDGDARLLGVELLDAAGAPCTLYYPHDRLRIRLGVEFLRPLTHVSIGVRLRNREGVKVYSWGTLNQDIAIWAGKAQGAIFWDRQFTAGQRATVELSCPVRLGAGFYEVQVAVTEERDRYYNDQRTIVWRDEAAFFQVQVRRDEHFFGGCFDLGMKADVLE